MIVKQRCGRGIIKGVCVVCCLCLLRVAGSQASAAEPEWRMEEERRANGIPLEEGVWKTLVDTASRLGVPW